MAAHIPQWAREVGFADAGIATLELSEDHAHLQRWLDAGRHGGMAYMQRDALLRQDPQQLRAGTVSVISARLNYRPDAEKAEAVLKDGDRAYISRYALGRDYHRLVRARLLKLAEKIEAVIGPYGHRVFADSAPVMEKALARNARLGWIGKNTLILNRAAGSWFFLGEIYTDLLLPAPTAPMAANECGKCSACLKICPTQAFVAPYQLDARRCISYLTIEHHGPIPLELRPLMGNRIFGCDDCQLVCPWNRYAQLSVEKDFQPRHQLDSAGLIELFGWSEAEWLRRTEGMALRRAGYLRWLRNLAVAMGNAPYSEKMVAALQRHIGHSDDTVREQVQWSLQQQTRQKTPPDPPE